MKAVQARRRAEKYTRKKHRKAVIKHYKGLRKVVKDRADNGRYFVDFSFAYNQPYLLAFRLFRIKNKSFKVTIKTGIESIYRDDLVKAKISW